MLYRMLTGSNYSMEDMKKGIIFYDVECRKIKSIIKKNGGKISLLDFEKEFYPNKLDKKGEIMPPKIRVGKIVYDKKGEKIKMPISILFIGFPFFTGWVNLAQFMCYTERLKMIEKDGTIYFGG